MESIPFPFEPYPEQKTLMHHIYSTLDVGGIALLESPTGTGKSLSIICSSLHWLTNYNKYKNKNNNNQTNNNSKESTPEWVYQFFEKQEKQQQQKRIDKKHELLRKKQEELYHNQPPNKRQKLNHSANNDDPYLLSQNNQDPQHRTANDWMKILNGDNSNYNDNKEEDDDIEYRSPQIIYCSRTHSQLLQFVNEIKKTKFNDGNLEILTVGSRKQLCIHPKISKFKSISKINDQCLNLKDTKRNKKIKKSIKTLTKKKKIKIGSKRDFNSIQMKDDDIDDDIDENDGCLYLNDKLSTLSLQITTKIHDIEDIHNIGKEMQICPYYGIRKAIHSAHLIAMPYTSLIHEKTRKSLGINIKDNIIIIDEAHNLIENINKIHTVNINLFQLKLSYYQLNEYKTKYINRLKHSNVTKIKIILKVLTSFIDYLSNSNHSKHLKHSNNNNNQQELDEFVISIDELLCDLKIDHINFYDLIDYINKSEIIRKLHGFIDKQYLDEIKKNNNNKNKNKNKNNRKQINDNQEKKENEIYENYNNSMTHSPLSFVVNIFEAFGNIDCDGTVIITKYFDAQYLNKNTFKFIMLNPYVHFKPILNECRSLILCGGTMQPLNHFIQQLFPPKFTTKPISTLSCNHVVSSHRVLALSIPSGPCQKKFDFTFKNRKNNDMIQDLGRAIVNFSNIIHGGIVIFFSSFKYLQYVLNYWKKPISNIYYRLSQRKRVLIEPESSTEVDAILAAYHDAIYPKQNENEGNKLIYNGGILLCVVGGKMSEGIDFKDDLARTVIMIGLPYPNRNDIELRERMIYLNNNIDIRAGNIYYQNLCMRAVNQSIGRAIRHKLDYGAILLMDYRYGQRQNIYESIPNWIKKSYVQCSSFQKAFQPFCKFINNMKKQTTN